MAQAKAAGVIDHMTFSIYTHPDPGVASMIKFGSYDQSAHLPGAEVVYVKTRSPETWELRGYALVMHYDRVRTGPTPKMVLIEPQLPYIYLPDEDWGGFLDAVARTFEADGVRCTGEYCFFLKPCSQVDGGAIAAKKMKILIFYDGMPEGRHTLNI